MSRTTTIAFMPAIGGAGASTLSIVAMEVLCAERQSQRSSCCVVNLNLQAGAVADYLDVRPNLDLEDIARAPERLDAHLLEVMLSQHKSGYSVLSALPSLSASESVNPQIIGRLLDLASTKFSTLIIDMPGLWMPWCDSVLHGTDKLYFVTDMSVAGLRHGQRLAQLVSDRHGVELNGSVIVNKSARLGVAGVKKQHAEVLLGSYFAGFIPDGRKHVLAAQNQGILPSEYKRKNALNTALRKILIQA